MVASAELLEGRVVTWAGPAGLNPDAAIEAAYGATPSEWQRIDDGTDDVMLTFRCAVTTPLERAPLVNLLLASAESAGRGSFDRVRAVDLARTLLDAALHGPTLFPDDDAAAS